MAKKSERFTKKELEAIVTSDDHQLLMRLLAEGILQLMRLNEKMPVF